MKTVGEILRTARNEKGITLEAVSISTKINKDFLKAIENNEFTKLPSEVATRGFIKNYAQFLTLDPESILPVFRRDFSKIQKQKFVSSTTGFKRKIHWSSRLILILISGIFFSGLTVYLIYQYFTYIRNPRLMVNYPLEGEQIKEEKIEVWGRASKEAVVKVNGNPVFLSSKGEFRYQLELFPGENKITIEAKSLAGKEEIIQRTIFRLDK